MAKKKSASPDIPALGAATAPPRLRRRPGAGAAPAPARLRNGDVRAAPSHEEIAWAAYQRYLSRGGGHGLDFDDWLDAERDLRSRAKSRSR